MPQNRDPRKRFRPKDRFLCVKDKHGWRDAITIVATGKKVEQGHPRNIRLGGNWVEYRDELFADIWCSYVVDMRRRLVGAEVLYAAK